MSMQPAHQQFRKAVRGFYAWLGSLVFAALAPFGALILIETETLPGRIAGAVLGSIGWLPMAWIIVAIIRGGDEFNRRLYLVSLSVAFGASLVFLTMIDWAVRAEFIDRPSLSALWVAFSLIWFASLMFFKQRFERVS